MEKFFASFKRFLYNVDGKISFRKIGLGLLMVAGFITLNSTDLSALHMPADILLACKVLAAAGVYFGLTGHIDAGDKR